MSRIGKRLVSLGLSLVMIGSIAYQGVCVSSVLNPVEVDAASTAKARVETFIGLAAGKSSIMSSDLASLSQEELKFLGVYLSNFYVPFDTELGDNEVMDVEKEHMVKTLKAGLNFNEEVAQTLVDTIVGLSRSNNKKLEFRISKDYQPSTQNAYETVKDFEVNYWTFMNAMQGTFFGMSQDTKNDISMGSLGAPWLIRSGNYTSNSNKGAIIPLTYIANVSGIPKSSIYDLAYTYTGRKLGDEDLDMTHTSYSGSSTNISWDYSDLLVDDNGIMKYDYGYFGYTNNNNEFVPVFDCTLYGDLEPTASMIAFSECMLTAGSGTGIGLTLFDFTADELDGNKVKGLNKELKGTDDSQLTKFSSYGIPMYIDCFGNIFSAGGNHQRVIIPACLNPYTWAKVEQNGTIGNPGTSMQLVSLPALTSVETNKDSFVSGINVAEDGTTGTFNSLKTYRNALGTNTELKKTLTGFVFESAYKTDLSQLPDDALEEIEFPDYDYADKQYKDISDKVIKHEVVLSSLTYTSKATRTTPAKDYFVHGKFDGFANPQTDNYYAWSEDLTTRYAWSLFRGDTKRESDSGLFSSTDFKTVFESLETVMGGASNNPWMYLSTVDGFNGLKGLDHASGVDRLKGAWYDSSATASGQQNNQVLGSYPADKSVTLSAFNKSVIIDNLGAFGWDTDAGSSIQYSAIQIQDVLNNGFNTNEKLNYDFTQGNLVFGSQRSTDANSAGTIQVPDLTQQAAVCMYTAYAIAGLTDTSASLNSSDLAVQLGYVITNEFPSITNAPLDIPSSTVDKMINNDIRNWIYYLMHPTEGRDYTKTLIRNKVNAILLDWHARMVGTAGMGIMTGSTYYRSNIGYVTIPDLSEVQWTATLMGWFYQITPLLIVFMIISMVLAFVLGILSWQRALIACVLFSIALFIPLNAINGVVETTNKLSTNIYGDKFTYWAVIQEETYGSALDSAASGDSYENYLKTLYATNNASQGSESIVLKWQAPKKMASLMLSAKDADGLKNVKQSALLNSSILGGAFSNETYLDGDSQYLFRGYSDIANFSRYIYNCLSKNPNLVNNSLGSTTVDELRTRWNNNSVKESVYGTAGNQDYTTAGYTGSDSRLIRIYAPTGASKLYAEKAVAQRDKLSSGVALDSSTVVGINQNNFKFSVAMFNQYSTLEGGDKRMFKAIQDGLQSYEGSPDEEVDNQYASLAAYALMSESPFYYYSWRLYDEGMNSGSLGYGGYKNIVLGDADGGFFYNNKTNGELKDFMDMRSLFTYIIPYLKLGNDAVKEYDDRYGIYYYDGVPSDENKGDGLTGEDKYKYWQNRNVARLYEMYTPWVDLMYDCSYAKPEVITVLGDKYTVEDPLDPACYLKDKGRPMIFSESEMYDFGLTTADLTKVERLILKFNKSAEEKMYELLNYYNCSDLALNTAAAMECTFAFNQTFSETGLFKDNINLYPQAYEIKDFSYDAFLRMILSTTTGDSLVGTTDFYGDIVERSSTTTAILMLVLDVLSQYVIPAFKLFLLVFLVLSSILLVLVTIVKVDSQMKFFPKLLNEMLLPLVEFMLVTVAFSFVVSMFMGTGNNAVTQTEGMVASMGDPNVVMIALCALDLLVSILYFKISSTVFKSVLSNIKMTFHFMQGVYGGVVAGVIGFAASSTKNAIEGSNGGGSFNESGTGREAVSASTRAGGDLYATVIEKHEDNRRQETSIRVENSNRMNVQQSSGGMNERRRDEISKTIEQGANRVSEQMHADAQMQEKESRRTAEDIKESVDSATE